MHPLKKDMHTPLAVDVEQIRQFVDALFCYADDGSFLSLRSFYDHQDGVFVIHSHSVNEREKIISEASALATCCANDRRSVTFCPPIATFANSEKATEASLANGLALSVECDQEPGDARRKLEELLGVATIVVASGGVWINSETGEIEDKLHLHWRLNEPTRTPAEHKMLKEARSLATILVGADASNKPIVHPIRWPGSWHRKSSPRMAHIIGKSENEIDLHEAVEMLRDAVAAARIEAPINGKKTEVVDNASSEIRDTAALVADITSGRDYHTPITALAMRYQKGGMPDAQVVLTLRGFMKSVPDHLRDMKDGTLSLGRWQARYDDIPRAVSTARSKCLARSSSHISLICAADFPPDVPPRIWFVDGWIAKGCVTGLFGPGGSGKSLLAQQLATSLAANFSEGRNDTNRAWIGQNVSGARVLAYFCEDDTDELHRRQQDINRSLGIDDPQIALRHFHLQSRTGKENLLMTFDKSVGTPTSFYAQIVDDIIKTKAQVVILDNAAQLFGGNENARVEVTQFVNLLHRLADETDTTIILLGHPAKGEGSEYSGSTAWDACFRARLYFGRPKDAGDNDPNLADMRVLRRSKSNYSRIGDEVQVRWSDGAFEAVSGDVSSMVDRIAIKNAEKLAHEKFLQLLDKLTEQGRNVSHSPQAKNYAPKMMAKVKGHSFTQKQFTEAMESLLDESIIAANMPVGLRGNRSKITGLARVKEAQNDGEKQEEDDCTEVHSGDL